MATIMSSCLNSEQNRLDNITTGYFRNRFCLKMVKCVTIFFVLLLVGCNQDDLANKSKPKQDDSERIVAVSYALQYLTQRVAGGEIEVEFPASGTSDPKNWSPTVKEIAALQKADLIVVNGPGAEYANWLVRVTLPDSKICKSCQDFDLRDYITVKDYQIIHTHGPEGEHSHPYFVPYPWLDPNLAAKQAETICKSLCHSYPDKEAAFQENLTALKLDLKSIAETYPTEQSENKLVSLNPYFKFLTRAIGLIDQHLLFFDEPSGADIDKVIKNVQQMLRDAKANHVVCSSTITEEFSNALNQSSIRFTKLDLLDTIPTKGDFLDAMKDNIEKLKALSETE